MDLFGRNPNEASYVGGRKHWADVIKNSGSGELMIWRQPEEDFNVNSTLIVMPGEEAVFVKNGNIESVFENGRYQLDTENYPIISRLRNAFTGGISTFHCVVYFVRKADSKEILWGTDSPIQVRDKVWGVRTDVRAHGAYKVRVENASLFLGKLLGNRVQCESQDGLNQYFFNEFLGTIKQEISKNLNAMEQELIGIDSRMGEIAAAIQPMLDHVMEAYGLRCAAFSLSGLHIDESKYDEIDKSQIESVSKVKLAQGDRQVMDILGENWDKQQAVHIMHDIAKTPGQGVGSVGAEMGMGMTAGMMMGQMAGQIFSSVSPKKENDEPADVLKKLKSLLDSELISNEEYEDKKKEILARM